jgi:hypothetical protein
LSKFFAQKKFNPLNLNPYSSRILKVVRGSSFKQKELQQFQEQQLANAQNQQKPTTAVSVRPQTFQTDPGTSVSQRPPVPKTPGMMPPGTAGNKKIEKKKIC